MPRVNGLESGVKKQEEELGKRKEDLRAARKLLDEKVSELNRLQEEIEEKRTNGH